MGVAIAEAAREAGHDVTLILGVATAPPPGGVRVVGVETTRQMHDAVAHEWPAHDLLIMNAAVADYRPKGAAEGKLRRAGGLVLELEPTEDILASAARGKRAEQRVVGFSLDVDDAASRERARAKLAAKGLDLIVFNPLATMDAPGVAAELYWSDGCGETVGAMDKASFARLLVQRAEALFLPSDKKER